MSSHLEINGREIRGIRKWAALAAIGLFVVAVYVVLASPAVVVALLSN